jgi:hypothetical protein
VDPPVRQHPPSAGRRGRRWGASRLWLLAFVGFLLLTFAWSIATPYDGAPDEREHIVRSAGVASGEVAPEPAAAKKGSGAFQTVPGGLVRDECWQHKPTVSVACAQQPGSDRTPTRMGTGAGRYQPVYYALVGWPLVLWPGWSGVLLARLVSAAICAALLAGAFVVITRWSRHRLMVAALLAATTPMAAHIGGAVNPNGPEIAAGVAFFAALVPLLLGHPDRDRRGAARPRRRERLIARRAPADRPAVAGHRRDRVRVPAAPQQFGQADAGPGGRLVDGGGRLGGGRVRHLVRGDEDLRPGRLHAQKKNMPLSRRPRVDETGG